MVDVASSITINRPLEVVADIAANPDNVKKWYANIKSVEWLTPRPLTLGTRLGFHARFLGRTLIYTYEVTDWIPFERLVMRTAQGPFPMETSYQWSSIDSSTTRMILRNRGEPSGLWSIIGPLMSMAIRRENAKDLERLKSLIEATDPSNP